MLLVDIGLLVLYLDKGKCDTLHDLGGGVRFSIVVSRGRLIPTPLKPVHSTFVTCRGFLRWKHVVWLSRNIVCIRFSVLKSVVKKY